MKRRWLWVVMAAAIAACVHPAMLAQHPGSAGEATSSLPGAPVPASASAGTTFTPAAEQPGSSDFFDPGGGTLFVTQPQPGATAPRKARVIYRGFNETPAGEGDEEGMKLAQLNGTLAGEIQQLEMKLRDADDEEVAEEIEEALNEKVGQQFDVRQQMRERQLAALEEQVERLRKIHNERADQRDRIVRDRVQQLIREAQGLGWGDAGEGESFKMSWSADSSWSSDAAPAYIQRKILSKKPEKLFDGGGMDFTPAAR